MNGGMVLSPLVAAMLVCAFRERVMAPDVDGGIAALASACDVEATEDDWRTAVEQALDAGYLHDPIRLPSGSLQCHWRLELTPLGADVARPLLLEGEV